MIKIFLSYYMINRRVRDLLFHHYLGYLSRKCGHARITPPPSPPPKISVFLALSPHRTLTTLLILEACSLLVTNLYHISQPRIFASRHWRVQWGMNGCHPNASCVNTQGSHNCSCNPTYFGNGSICEGKFVIFRPRDLIMNVFLNVIKERAEFVIQMFDKWKHKSLSPNTLRNYCHF